MTPNSIFQMLKNYLLSFRDVPFPDLSAPPPSYVQHTETPTKEKCPDSRITQRKRILEGIEKFGITATDAPQWSWSKLECQIWLSVLLTTKLDYTIIDALEISERLEGFGPNLYSRRISHWAELLGQEDAKAVYFWILQFRDCEGAVPEQVLVTHGNENLDGDTVSTKY
jgi:hypothetical protein